MLKAKLGLTATEMPELGGAIFAYLFHRIDQRELVSIIGDKERSAEILEVIKSDGWILKNCKLYAWAAYKARYEGPVPKPSRYGLTRSDYRLLNRLDLTHLPLRFEALDLEDFDVLVDDSLNCQAMQAYIGKLISRKMMFLIRSYGVPRPDMENELKQAAVRAIYMHYPRYESSLHVMNIAKRTIHNTAMTMIKHYTALSRQRLSMSMDGMFEARHVEVDMLSGLPAPSGYLEHAREQLEVLATITDREKMRPDVQRFLMCCAGHYDEGFSEFLDQDNSEAVEDMAYSRYLSKARRYFEFSTWQVDRLFYKLRLRLE